jgi:hypothetical protein
MHLLQFIAESVSFEEERSPGRTCMNKSSNRRHAKRKARTKTAPASSWLAVASRERTQAVTVREATTVVSSGTARGADQVNASKDDDTVWSNVPLAADPPPENDSTTDPRHVVRCSICQHPMRELIERDFIEWRSVASICANYELRSKTTVYLHVRALGLFAERRRNIHLALENLIEQSEGVVPSSPSVVKAVELHARISGIFSRPESARTKLPGVSRRAGRKVKSRDPVLLGSRMSVSGMRELHPAQV